jgi:hypothetical protein
LYRLVKEHPATWPMLATQGEPSCVEQTIYSYLESDIFARARCDHCGDELGRLHQCVLLAGAFGGDLVTIAE